MSRFSFLNPRTLFELFREAFREWSEDKAVRLGAALSFYTVIALPPLLVLMAAAAGVVFGRDAAHERIASQIGALVGQHGRGMIDGMMTGQSQPGSTLLASIFGVVLLVFGASGVFGQLHDALNTVWEVEEKPGGGLKKLVKDRIFSFNLLLGAGFVLIVSLMVSAALGALTNLWGDRFEGMKVLLAILDFAVSTGVLGGLFALLLRFVPDAKVAWRDAWVGGLVTAVLFTIGKVAIGIYLGRGTVGTAYGAAGPLVILLLWIYYSAQIFLYGAEFTEVFAKRHGAGLAPKPGRAVAAGEEKEKSPAERPRRPPARSVPSRSDRGDAAPRKTSPGGFAWWGALAALLLLDHFRRKKT